MFRKTLLLLIVLAVCLPPLASAQLGRWGEDTEGDLDSMIRSGRFKPFI